jgi:hypothetical protein
MRYLLLSLIIVFSLIACKQFVKGKNGITYNSPKKYNNYIINRQTSLMKQVLEINIIAAKNIDSAEAMRTRSVKDIDNMIIEIKGMPPFNGDSALRDAATESFTFYKQLFENDYKIVLNIRKKTEAETTQEEEDEVSRIVENINKKEESLDKAFHHAQKNFAEKNKMELITNQIQKDFEKELDKRDK